MIPESLSHVHGVCATFLFVRDVLSSTGWTSQMMLNAERMFYENELKEREETPQQRMDKMAQRGYPRRGHFSYGVLAPSSVGYMLFYSSIFTALSDFGTTRQYC